MKAACLGLILGLLPAGLPAAAADLKLPEPPRQHTRWQPPAGMATNLLSAIETLFAQGFPDPRGCEYRTVEVQVCGVWEPEATNVTTRGWVLPAGFLNHDRFAICWNGLIYPVKTVGDLCDLHADATNDAPQRIMRGGWMLDSSAGEPDTVTFASTLTTRIPLLIRMGDAETALKKWLATPPQSRFVYLRHGGYSIPADARDPYLELAGDWAWAMYDRTLAAHLRGDESLALASARQLAALQPKIEAECARRGFPRQSYYDPAHRGQIHPYLEFLESFPPLLADLERRAREDPQAHAACGHWQDITNQSDRVQQLVRDLDQVSQLQVESPGYGGLADNPVVTALVSEGDAAVEPLLDCLEHDQRLTRTISLTQYFSRERQVVPVRRIAETALQQILHASFNGNIPVLRAYWNQYKGLKLEDRWYAILQDDAARSHWVEAADCIVQPANDSADHTCFRGETLRGKTSPTVTELLGRDALAVPTDTGSHYDPAAAGQLALDLAAWDLPAALPVAQKLSHRLCTIMKYAGGSQGALLARLTQVRAQAGDAHAFDDYAAWLLTTSPADRDFPLAESLYPFRQYPTNQVLLATAETLLGSTNSAWGRLPWRNGYDDSTVDAGLTVLPAYRHLLARELERTNVCGVFRVNAARQIYYNYTNNAQVHMGNYTLPEEQQPAENAVAEMRWCDWIAMCLFCQNHLPAFNPFAPVAARNEVIRQARFELLH